MFVIQIIQICNVSLCVCVCVCVGGFHLCSGITKSEIISAKSSFSISPYVKVFVDKKGIKPAQNDTTSPLPIPPRSSDRHMYGVKGGVPTADSSVISVWI